MIIAGFLYSLEHVSSSLLSNPKFFADLHTGYALACHAHLVHRIKPCSYWQLAGLHDGICLATELVAAVSAMIIELPGFVFISVHTATSRAIAALRPSNGFIKRDRLFFGIELA